MRTFRVLDASAPKATALFASPLGWLPGWGEWVIDRAKLALPWRPGLACAGFKSRVTLDDDDMGAGAAGQGQQAKQHLMISSRGEDLYCTSPT